MNPLKIEFIKLNEHAKVPTYAHHGDGGMDLSSIEDVFLEPGDRKIVGTGIACAIPFGYCGFVLPRSGMAAVHGITIVNAPGLIDASYRGEIKVILLNTDKEKSYNIDKGDRIAQLSIQKVYPVDWEEVAELTGEDRGGGLGHSGR